MSSLDSQTPEWRAQAARWIETWRVAGPLLEKFKREELRASDPRRDWEIIDSLLELGCRDIIYSQTTGLIEQQRLFQKSRT